jgi:hypothetical protein
MQVSHKKYLTETCLCGCGEEIPFVNKSKDYYFVNQNHEKIYKRQQVMKEVSDNKDVEKRKYCRNYHNDHIACIRCYSNGDCEYRGCYANPRIRKD